MLDKYHNDYKHLEVAMLESELHKAQDDLLFWLDKDADEAKEYSERIEFLGEYIAKRTGHSTMSQSVRILADMGFLSEEDLGDYHIMSYGSGPSKSVVSVGIDGLIDGTCTIDEILKEVGIC